MAEMSLCSSKTLEPNLCGEATKWATLQQKNTNESLESLGIGVTIFVA